MRRQTDKRAWDQSLIEGVLGNAQLFRGGTQAQLRALASQCSCMAAERGQRLVDVGARVPGIFLVAYGQVKVSLLQDHVEEKVVRLVQAGQDFGIACAVTGLPAAFEATAVEKCKLVVVPAVALLALIERDPRSAWQVVLTLSRRNLELLSDLRDATLRTGAQRLAAYLAALPAEPAGEASAVQLPATKTLVASRLDMKKETLSRLLQSLTIRGVIRVEGGQITILDRESLSTLAQ